MLACAVAPSRAQIYVSKGASGANDGTSWGDAYETLQKALNNAESGDEIWIAEGVYYPDEGPSVTGNNEGASFTITGNQDELKVYGGFDGTESSRSARDPAANPTVLSGDIDADNGGADNNKTADGVTPTAGDITGNNSHHVVVFNGGTSIGANNGPGKNISSSTVLDGVIVTGGDADASSFPDNVGGGLYCDGQGSDNRCNPQITAVTFEGNRAGAVGGAIYNNGRDGGTSSPTITNVTFTNNNASSDGGAIYNNATLNIGTSSPTITNTVFTDNRAGTSSTAGSGGAIYNFANDGTSSPTITNAVFSGNSATSSGGAIYNFANVGTSSPNITNVTFTDNSAPRGEAIYNSASSLGTASPTITNTILWANSTDGDGDEIYNNVQGNDASATINYSIVQNGDDGIVNDNDGFSNGNGNLNQDPQFAGPDDLRLQGPNSGGGASPAIDAGDNTVISQSVDLAGNTRNKDVSGVPNDGNTPNGNAPVDIGAYESTGAPLPVELASFEAQTTEGAVALTWQTASESGNAGFAVQRRAEGGTWSKVGFVDSKAEGGTTDQPRSYRFTDADLPYAADSLTYRLRQVDVDGSATLTEPVTVARGVQSVQLLGTAPNPVRSQATVRYAVPNKQEVTIRLYDVLGRAVRTAADGMAKGRHRQTIDLSGLSSGVYVLRLTAGGTTKTQKMTVVQ